MTGKKGFSGFEDLVSDVDGDISGARKEAVASKSPEASAKTPQPVPPSSNPDSSLPSKPSEFKGKGWLAIGLAVVVLTVVGTVSNQRTEKPAPSSTKAPVSAPVMEPAKPAPPVPLPETNARKGTPAEGNIVDAKVNAAWLKEMSSRLPGKVPNKEERLEMLKAVNYEAKRAGLDPQLVLAIIDVSSGFRKYAVAADRKGYMMLPTFWVEKLGTGSESLFHLRTNLRYGCTVFRHYLDNSGGNVKAALEQYGGADMGDEEFARRVIAATNQAWKYPGKPEPLPAATKPKAEAPAFNAPARSPYCDIEFSIELETFGEGVTVELRAGVPGNSKVLSTKSSRGGHVGFSGLCAGKHFLAIGNGESVSVTPTRDFESGRRYSSRLTMQRGSGNVSSRSRGAL